MFFDILVHLNPWHKKDDRKTHRFPKFVVRLSRLRRNQEKFKVPNTYKGNQCASEGIYHHANASHARQGQQTGFNLIAHQSQTRNYTKYNNSGV